MGRSTSPIHDSVGPGIDGSIPPFSKVSVLMVWSRLPITDLVGPEDVLNLVENLILAESLISLSIALHLHILSSKVLTNSYQTSLGICQKPKILSQQKVVPF